MKNQEIDKLKTEFHQLRYDDKDFAKQYDEDEFQHWYMDYIPPIDRYIDFGGICEDYNLTSGDITPSQTIELENIIQEFIKQNK